MSRVPTIVLAAAAALACVASPAPAPAQTAGAQRAATRVVVAARPIRSREVISPGDVELAAASDAASDALGDPAEAIGMEARVTLYPGRPVRRGDLARPALVERNQIVTLTFRRGALAIVAEGRALDRGGRGDRIRALNMDSRVRVTGRVTGPGSLEVGR